MNLPPALSWMCLFDGDTFFDCPEGPPWLCDALNALSIASGERVAVTWQGSHSRSPGLTSCDGLVAFNDHALTKDILQREGFEYARRFAVLPNIAAPRFFIPLDTRSITAGAFALYKPVSWRSRWKHWGARLAARTGSQAWFRDHVWVARRRVSQMDCLLQDLFRHPEKQPDSHDSPAQPRIRIAISTGNVATVKNRKLTLAVLDQYGSAVGFGKLSLSPLSRRRVQHEGRFLQSIARRSSPVAAPRLLLHADIGAESLIVTSPLAGRVPAPRITAAHHALLQSFQLGARKPVSDTEFARRLFDRSTDDTPTEHWLRKLLLANLTELESIVLPTTMVHRDFAPWNLRQKGRVLSAFDWEYAATEGPPLLDELHHLLAVAYFVDRTTPQQACDRLLEYERHGSSEVRPQHVPPLQVLYLIDHLLLLLDEGYREDYPKFVWWKEVLTRLLTAQGRGSHRETIAPAYRSPAT